MAENVVIYARYSSDRQTEQSIEGQLKECYAFCRQHEYNVIREYIDRAMSAKTDNRPEFLRMIQDSAKKQFQYIVVYQLDRFSRNRYDSAIYKQKLSKNGVRVLSAKENISDDASGILIESVLEGMAEYYSVELAQKIRRGMDINGEKCLSTGGTVSLGYRVGKDKRYEIDPDKAPVVVMIFEMYASGKTVTEIIKHLNALGYKTARGQAFTKNSLHTIIKNKRYIGVYSYMGKETPGGLPRIISDELFEKVAKIMKKNEKAPARSKAKVEYLLTTKLFCGHCGSMMTGFSGTSHMGKVYRYYTCNGAKKLGCKKKMVSKDYIEDLVVVECRKMLTPSNIDRISTEIAQLCEMEKDTSNLTYLKKTLKENERKQQNTIDAVTECESASIRNSLYQKLQALESEHKELERQIAMESAVLPTLTEPRIKFFLTSLRKGNINDIKYRKTLITVLVNKIYLYDDRVTITFNSGDIPVTIDDILLSKISEGTSSPEGLFLDCDGPPQQYYSNPYCYVGGFAVTVWFG